MKTTSFSADGCSRRFSQCACAAATILAASLIFTQPVFAQANVGSDPDNPLPWGSTTVANPAYSGDTASAPSAAAMSPLYGDVAPSYGDVGPSYDESLVDGGVMAPAPAEPVDPEKSGSLYVAPPPVGLVEQFGHPPVNPATSPELIPPDSFARPAGGFQPEGVFHNNYR